MTNETEKVHTVTAKSAMPVEYGTTVASTFAMPLAAHAIVMADFAKDWFDDAVHEATRKTDDEITTAAARRKEIIFAVCALESYLFEWVRNIIRSRNPANLLIELDKYFTGNHPITDKWKRIPNTLRVDGLVKAAPNLSSGQTQENWKSFLKVYYYRNALIHAGASRPQPEVKPGQPTDWKAELSRLPAGWAMDIVAKLIKDLHDAEGTTQPTWSQSLSCRLS